MLHITLYYAIVCERFILQKDFILWKKEIAIWILEQVKLVFKNMNSSMHKIKVLLVAYLPNIICYVLYASSSILCFVAVYASSHIHCAVYASRHILCSICFPRYRIDDYRKIETMTNFLSISEASNMLWEACGTPPVAKTVRCIHCGSNHQYNLCLDDTFYSHQVVLFFLWFFASQMGESNKWPFLKQFCG